MSHRLPPSNAHHPRPPARRPPAIWAPIVWPLCSGRAGDRSQMRALLEILGLSLPLLTLRKPLWGGAWRKPLWGGAQHPNLVQEAQNGVSAPLGPPDLILAPSSTTRLAARIKSLTPETTRIVGLNRPRSPKGRAAVDLFILHAHDHWAPKNACVIETALHTITPQRLAAAQARWEPEFSALPYPRVAVLVGGSNSHFLLTSSACRRLVQALRNLVHSENCSLLVTTSARSGRANHEILSRGLHGLPARIWPCLGEKTQRPAHKNAQAPNPYLGFLALADFIIVTCESVSMISEAMATQKPIFTFPLPHYPPQKGMNSRFGDFLRAQQRQGRLRPFDGRLATWTYAAPPDPRPYIKQRVDALLAARPEKP